MQLAELVLEDGRLYVLGLVRLELRWNLRRLFPEVRGSKPRAAYGEVHSRSYFFQFHMRQLRYTQAAPWRSMEEIIKYIKAKRTGVPDFFSLMA